MKSNFFPSPRPKCLFFDAAGTLVHLPRGVGFHYREVLARHGVESEAAALDAAFRRVWRDIPPPVQGKKPRPDDDKGWWRDLVARVLRECLVAEAALNFPAFFEELYEEFARPGVWSLYPEVREVLAALASQFTLGVITNFDGRFRAVARHLDLDRWFSHVFISSEIGADKPHRMIFDCAVRAAGMQAAEALHIGDDPECDWEGAAAAGLQVFPLNRPRNDLRDLLALL